MKNNLVALSIFCFAVCFVIGSWLISDGLREKQTNPIKQTSQHQLLTQSELADYLGISIEEVQKLNRFDNGTNSYRSLLPHIKIENAVYYPKVAIDKWIQNVERLVIQ
ncbi:helix-turn-helix domain-containing protein [Brevibacillus daliensis]|uniref:helix-turn-helix domain-containing protein n=1 Tax=Brevibacillus daliensis TaxID=2892995 RepID=UPI001E5CAF56|nr:helix-turn-helix domain-containing protein [Brevibacillus daliensis]